MEEDLNAEALRKISTEINPSEWKRLGRNLGLDEYELESLEHDNLMYGSRECCYQMLLRWNRKQGQLKKKEMLKALSAMNRNDIVMMLKGERPGDFQSRGHVHHHQLPSSFVPESDVLKPSDLKTVSALLKPGEWKQLGRYLGLNESTLHSIDYDNSFAGLEECCYQTLLKWTQMYGSMATREKLTNALSSIRRYDIIECMFSDSHKIEKKQFEPSISKTNTLSQGELQIVSEQLNSYEWKDLGKLLGLSDSALDKVDYEHHLLGPSECAFQMLKKWTEVNGSEATKEILIDQLCAICRIDLVERLFPMT